MGKNSFIVLKQISQQPLPGTIQQQFCPNRLYTNIIWQTDSSTPQSHEDEALEVPRRRQTGIESVVNIKWLGIFLISWSHVKTNHCLVEFRTEADWQKGSGNWICLILRSSVTYEQMTSLPWKRKQWTLSPFLNRRLSVGTERKPLEASFVNI